MKLPFREIQGAGVLTDPTHATLEPMHQRPKLRQRKRIRNVRKSPYLRAKRRIRDIYFGRG